MTALSTLCERSTGMILNPSTHTLNVIVNAHLLPRTQHHHLGPAQLCRVVSDKLTNKVCRKGPGAWGLATNMTSRHPLHPHHYKQKESRLILERNQKRRGWDYVSYESRAMCSKGNWNLEGKVVTQYTSMQGAPLDRPVNSGFQLANYLLELAMCTRRIQDCGQTLLQCFRWGIGIRLTKVQSASATYSHLLCRLTTRLHRRS